MFVSRRQVTRFVVLVPGRVGSTYLVSALAEHPQIAVEGEVLSSLRDAGADRQLAWSHDWWQGRAIGRARARGFKTKLRDILDSERFAAMIHDLDVRVVLMDRRNDVKHAVSRVTAKALHETTGKWNRYDDDARPAPVQIDLERFHRLLSGVVADKRHIDDYVTKLHRPTLRIDYEDLLSDPGAIFASVQQFIGVAPRTVAGATQKNTSDNLREAVANFDELRASVDDPSLAAMFDE